jgi:hypothetical protein
MNLLNKFMETTGQARNTGCSREGAAGPFIFPYLIFNLPYQLNAPSDSMLFRAADSEVDLERHVIIQPI